MIMRIYVGSFDDEEAEKITEDLRKAGIKTELRHALNIDMKDSYYIKGKINELKEKYAEEIKLADEEWWVFRKVSEKLNYKIFMAHAEEIGYKRGLRGEEQRPNQLFQTDENGNIVIDTENPKTILDYLRKAVKWRY